jgi:hypothetical protein
MNGAFKSPDWSGLFLIFLPDSIGIKGVRYIEVDIITILFRLKRVKSG